MTRFRKRHLAGVIVATLCAAALPAAAQEILPDAGAPAAAEPAAPATPELPADRDARLDALFAELAEPGRSDWEKVEGEIGRIWARSGSASMDLLLRRGNEAMEAEDLPTAIEHFSALVELAPDFAEGWNARATAFYMMGEFSLSMADIEHVLVLEPRHFGALSGLAFIFEAMDEPARALEVFEAVHRITPNRPNVNESIARLERMTGEADL